MKKGASGHIIFNTSFLQNKQCLNQRMLLKWINTYKTCLFLSSLPTWHCSLVLTTKFIKVCWQWFTGEHWIVNLLQYHSMLFLAHVAIGHVSFCHQVSSVVVVVNFSHFNLFHRNHRANLDQTLVEWSLDGLLPKLCPVIPTSNQAKNRKRGDEF